MTLKPFTLAALIFTFALPAMAQTPPVDPEAPPTAAPPAAVEEKPPFKKRIFIGGGVAAGFGTIEYVSLAPMVGFHVVPRLDLGIQPYYSWTHDGRYSPSVSTSDYGCSLFARVPIFRGLFAEADYQYTNYEYPDAFGGTTRSTHNGFLAGAGYSIPAGRNVGFYASALYDFAYDGNDPYRPYDSPVRFQVGVSVGF
jgi:hypothetical protein